MQEEFVELYFICFEYIKDFELSGMDWYLIRKSKSLYQTEAYKTIPLNLCFPLIPHFPLIFSGFSLFISKWKDPIPNKQLAPMFSKIIPKTDTRLEIISVRVSEKARSGKFRHHIET